MNSYCSRQLLKLLTALLIGMAAGLLAGPGSAQEAKPAAAPGNEPRIALVIGNSAYRTAASLKNASNDARSMAAMLADAGFAVIYRQDASQKEMASLIRRFGDRLRDGGVGLFYYAGHGMQVRGRNYLIPVDAEIEREDEVAYNGIDANLVLEKMESANNRLNIVILDACRNNPFARSFRSGSQGLAQMEAPVGTLVAFATAPGSVASDGDGENGLYTRHLLENMRQPGMRIEDVFKNVRTAVRRDSGGKQVPWEATSLEGDFYFRAATKSTAAQEPAAGPAGSASRDSDAFELAFWDAIKSSTNPGDYKSYLAEFPKGRFAGLARNRIAAGAGQAASPSPGASSSSMALAKKAESASGTTPRQASEALAKDIGVSDIKPGDRWEYRIVDEFRKAKVRDDILEVEKIGADGIQFANQSYRTDLTGVNILRTEQGTSYSPSNEMLRLPIEVGKKWSGSFTVTTKENRTTVSEYKSMVLGKERVTVPAGSFDAFRIEQTLYFNGGDAASAVSTAAWASASAPWLTTTRLWFSPEIRNLVKIESTTRNNLGKIVEWEVRELIGYQVH